MIIARGLTRLELTCLQLSYSDFLQKLKERYLVRVRERKAFQALKPPRAGRAFVWQLCARAAVIFEIIHPFAVTGQENRLGRGTKAPGTDSSLPEPRWEPGQCQPLTGAPLSPQPALLSLPRSRTWRLTCSGRWRRGWLKKPPCWSL